MAVKILENKGIETTGLSASAINKLITAGKSGIVGRYLNECALSATGNTVIISTGKMIIGGVQLEIDTPVSLTLSSVPTEDVRYQVVVELRKGEDDQWVDDIFVRLPSPLIQENFTQGGYTYQLELGRVTHKTTGQVTEVLRTADILYGQSGAGADIEVGEVNTQMISTELPAEVNINKTVDSGKTKLNFDFSLPKPYEDSVTGLVYSTQIAGNPVNIKNTNDGFVDKVKITNDTASAIESPLTGKSVGKNLLDKTNLNDYTTSTWGVTYPNETQIKIEHKQPYSSTVPAIYLLVPKNKTIFVSWVFIESIGLTGQIDLYKSTNGVNYTYVSFVRDYNEGFSFNSGDTQYYQLRFGVNNYEKIGHYILDNLSVSVDSNVDFEPYTATAFSIPLKDTSGTVLDLNPADVIEMIDGKYHLNDTELHDDSQDALRSIPTKQGQTNLIGDQPFTFDITELAMGIGEKKYALLTDGDGNAVMPATEANNTLMFDGRTVEQGLQELRKDIDNLNLIPYDVVIRTQAEFEALIKSPTWLDAKSVALVGQFVYDEPDNSGIKIPQTVKQIHGFNSAKITITNFVYNETTAKGGMWYNTRPTTLDYSIRDLEVDCTGTGIDVIGFYNCTNLTNCTGTGIETGTGSGRGYGFYSCIYLTNCTGTGTGSGTGRGFGFRSCTNLMNCTGTGTGSGTGYGYGFYSITYASNCKDGDSSTNMWGGINENINVETCRKTLVEADNTTLNT